jgi:hypothetical protein
VLLALVLATTVVGALAFVVLSRDVAVRSAVCSCGALAVAVRNASLVAISRIKAGTW